MSMFTQKFMMDTAERAIATFAQAFIAAFVVADMATAKVACVAGLSAVLSMLKGIVATKRGDAESASLLA